MPQIRVVPSIELSDKDSLLKAISKEVSNLTGKNEQWVMASIEPNVSMSFSGTTDPCCYAELKNIGEIDGAKFQAPLSKLISDKTGIPTATKPYLKSVSDAAVNETRGFWNEPDPKSIKKNANPYVSSQYPYNHVHES